MAIAVTPTKTKLLSSAAAAVLALPFWAASVLAQEAQAQTEGTEQAQQTDQAQQSGDAGQAADGQQGQGQGEATDVLIATIGDTEIRNSDLMRAIGALPPPLNAQPPEMLVPMVLQQILMREAIVQEARSQGLGEDPEVQSLVEGATQTAEEDALVQVWLQRELESRVTPEAVEAAYAGLRAVAGDQPVPPLEQIRPQIQQSLAQQALSEIQGSLLTDAQITLYGPDGQPLDQQASAGGQGGTGGEAATEGQGATGEQADTGDQSGDASGGSQEPSQDDGASGEATSGDQGGTEEESSGN